MSSGGQNRMSLDTWATRWAEGPAGYCCPGCHGMDGSSINMPASTARRLRAVSRYSHSTCMSMPTTVRLTP
jgi:hypothetical protein